MSTTLSLSALSLTLLALTSFQDSEGVPPDVRVPRVLLESAAGVTRAATLDQFETRSLSEHDAVLVRFEGLGQGPAPFEAQTVCEAHLAGGAGLARGLLFGGDGELLDLRLIGGSRLRLSIEEIASLRVPSRVPSDWTEPIVKADEGDRLYRTRGLGLDRIDGTVEEFSDEGLRMDTALGSKLFAWKEVAALFVEVFDEQASTSEGERVVVDLIDGSRLPGTFSRLSADGVELLTASGRGLSLPLEVVSEIFRMEAGLDFLSNLEPVSSVSSSPFGDELGMRWPMRRDRSTTGGPLRAGGRVWTRGLGVHAPSRLDYQLDGAWRGLRGSVAIDDEVIHLPARGSVRFRVHGDERVLWESEVVHGGDEPVAFPQLDLSGVQRLTLEVDMADEMHVGDRADWLRLILVR